MLVWGSCGAALFSELENIHVRAAKLIYGLDWLYPQRWGITANQVEVIKQMYIRRVLCFVFKGVSGDVPFHLRHLWLKHESRHNLRRKNCLVLLKPNTDFVKKSVKFMGASLWNSLEHNARLEESLAGFKSSVQELGFLIFKFRDFLWFSLVIDFLIYCYFLKRHDHISYHAAIFIVYIL